MNYKLGLSSYKKKLDVLRHFIRYTKKYTDLEHYDYLKRTFKHNWSPSTNEKVGDIQKKWIKLMNNVSHNDSKFSVYGQSDRWLKMTKYALEMRHGQNIDFRTHR